MTAQAGLTPATQITIKINDGDYLEWMDKDLPMPSTVQEISRYGADYWNDKDDTTPYEITYHIDGFFGTANGKKYLHDTASKIASTLNGSYSIKERSVSSLTYNLSRFNHLERVPTFNRELESNAWNGSRNEIFNALRHRAYRMHKTNTLNLEALTFYGNQISNGSEHVKYLANNIYRWVEDHYTGRQSTMSRSEAGINASKVKSARTQKKIFTALKNPLFFNLSSLSSLSASRIVGVSFNTYKKYLQQFQNLQTASQLIQTLSTPYMQLVLNGIETMVKSVEIVSQWYTIEEAGAIKVPVSCVSPP